MDTLDLAFLAIFRTRRDAAQAIRRHGVVRFRRQLRQGARLVDYPVTGDDACRVLGTVDSLMGDVLALAYPPNFRGAPSPRLLGCRQR